ncbi:lysylphosphatidylglycerol synthase domain-containing protein [Yoonia sp. BS5-3]|uniref:Lysylphosphatidylglycerol synthase domain-containing protein n=1 Tax=Yoonia phaeophyticola TaxID=3137369 RepID=A0ABZ2V8T3_9RHOB
MSIAPLTYWRGAGRSQRLGILAGYLVVYAATVGILLIISNAVSPFVAIAAGTIYIFSHIFRALRLAALSVDALGLSARTTAAMHFATAPFSLLLPFKLGELVRFFALYKMGGKAAHAVTVLLLDRMFDSLLLVPILMLLILQSDASMALATFTLLAATLPLAVICIGPGLLSEVQRYVVASHDNPMSLKSLKTLDRLRRLVIHATQVAWRQAPQMFVLSLLIWLCEFVVCMILVAHADALFQAALDLLGARLVAFWTHGGMAQPLAVAIGVTLMAQLLLWPMMALYFMDRLTSRGADPEQKKKEVAG